MYYFRYLLINKHNKKLTFIQQMLENETFLYISYSTCPTVYVNTHLSCLTYGRVSTKGRYYVGTRNLRIETINESERISCKHIIYIAGNI